jgi:hypothetical protein
MLTARMNSAVQRQMRDRISGQYLRHSQERLATQTRLAVGLHCCPRDWLVGWQQLSQVSPSRYTVQAFF